LEKQKESFLIRALINQAATQEGNGFEFVESVSGYDFYRKSILEDKRFLVVHETETLLSAVDYNLQIDKYVPEELKRDPAFEKNSDLVILFKLSNLSDFNSYDRSIFSIEEDPYHFKKYVLYYSEEELGYIKDKMLSDLNNVILNRELFKAYKKDPNFPSEYSLAVRIFIKVPFLKVPVEEKKLESIDVMLTECFKENKLINFNSDLDTLIEKYRGDPDGIIAEYISGKIEAK